MISKTGLKGLRECHPERQRGIPLALLVLLFSLSAAAYTKSYRSNLKEWTRSKQLFSTTDVQVKILAHATYFSPEFRKAFTKQHIKKMYLKGEEAARFREQQEIADARGHEFFVGIYSPKPYRQFTSGPDTFWQAVLVTSQGEELKPLSVTPVGTAPYEKVMFPYLNRWEKAYRVVFPKAALGEEFHFTLRSVIGQTHLRWN